MAEGKYAEKEQEGARVGEMRSEKEHVSGRRGGKERKKRVLD